MIQVAIPIALIQHPSFSQCWAMQMSHCHSPQHLPIATTATTVLVPLQHHHLWHLSQHQQLLRQTTLMVSICWAYSILIQAPSIAFHNDFGIANATHFQYSGFETQQTTWIIYQAHCTIPLRKQIQITEYNFVLVNHTAIKRWKWLQCAVSCMCIIFLVLHCASSVLMLSAIIKL